MLVLAWFGMVTTVGEGKSHDNLLQVALRPPFKYQDLPIDSFWISMGRLRQLPPGGTMARYLSFRGLKFIIEGSGSMKSPPIASRNVANGGKASSIRLLN